MILLLFPEHVFFMINFILTFLACSSEKMENETAETGTLPSPINQFGIQAQGEQSRLGRSIATGDFNGDGFEDLALGAYNQEGPGSVFIYYGKTLKDLEEGQILKDADLVLTSGTDDEDEDFGWALSVKDINGDGFDDLLVGAPAMEGSANGAAYLYLGGGSGLSLSADLSFSPPDVTHETPSDGYGEQFGTSVHFAGDFNGDGTEEIAIGSPHYSADGDDMGGRVSVWSVSEDMTSSLLDEYKGGEEKLGFGNSLDSGDFNGDGTQELVLGSKSQNIPFTEEMVPAKVVVLRWEGSGLSSLTVIEGDNPYTSFGIEVLVGDFNNDGISDLAIAQASYFCTGYETNPDGTPRDGAEDVCTDEDYYARVFLYQGGEDFGTLSSTLEDSENISSGMGFYMTSGDVDGDGDEDLVLSAPGSGDGAGFVYVYENDHGKFTKKLDICNNHATNVNFGEAGDLVSINGGLYLVVSGYRLSYNQADIDSGDPFSWVNSDDECSGISPESQDKTTTDAMNYSEAGFLWAVNLNSLI